MASTTRIDFVVLGRFDPDQYALDLSLQPEKTWREGESKMGTLLKHESDGLVLSTGEREEASIGVLLLEILARITHCKTELTRMAEAGEMSAGVDVCLYVEGGETPEFNLSSEVIQSLADLRVSLDVDIIEIEGD